MEVMNGSLNSDKDWKFSPDSYGDFYGGLRERPSTVHNEPVNDHHELPPDAFRRMEIPECTNERRSSLSVLLERESPVVLPKDITHDDDEVYTPPVDTSPTTTSTFSSLEMLPSALKKIPMHEHDQFAANTHWMKIVANVSSDSEDSDSDEEENAFYNVLGINVNGERLSTGVPVTCLNFDRSPTKSMSQRLKIRYGIHNNEEANDSKNNMSSSSYRAGAKVRFELERAAQKKPQFLDAFHILACPPDISTAGNMVWKEEEEGEENESSFRPYKKGNMAAWKEMIAQGQEIAFGQGLIAQGQGLEMEVTKDSSKIVPQRQNLPFPPQPPTPYVYSSFSNLPSQQPSSLSSTTPHHSIVTPTNDRISQSSQSNPTAPSQKFESNLTAPSQTSQSNANDRMMEHFKTITTTTWTSVTGAVSSILTSSKNGCHIKQSASNYYEHKGTYPGVNLHQQHNPPAFTRPTTPPSPTPPSP